MEAGQTTVLRPDYDSVDDWRFWMKVSWTGRAWMIWTNESDPLALVPDFDLICCWSFECDPALAEAADECCWLLCFLLILYLVLYLILHLLLYLALFWTNPLCWTIDSPYLPANSDSFDWFQAHRPPFVRLVWLTYRNQPISYSPHSQSEEARRFQPTFWRLSVDAF